MPIVKGERDQIRELLRTSLDGTSYGSPGVSPYRMEHGAHRMSGEVHLKDKAMAGLREKKKKRRGKGKKKNLGNGGGEHDEETVTGSQSNAHADIAKDSANNSVDVIENKDLNSSKEKNEISRNDMVEHVQESPHDRETVTSPKQIRSGTELWGIARRSLSAIARAIDEKDQKIQPEHVEIDNGYPLLSRSRATENFIQNRLLVSLQRVRSENMVPQNREDDESHTMPLIPEGYDELGAHARKDATFTPWKDARLLFRMIFSSYLNLLLIALPAGIIAGVVNAHPATVFTLNFLALLPLALILGEVTEDLAVRFGDAIGGLLNATFGNAVEMILGLAALFKGLNSVVAASMIGSVLSNLLLVMGCSFLFAGFRFQGLRFNTLANKVSCSLLFLSTVSISIPTTARMTLGSDAMPQNVMRELSRAISVFLLLLYFCYLYFQLITHKESFNAPAEESQLKNSGSSISNGGSTNLDVSLYQSNIDESSTHDEENPPTNEEALVNEEGNEVAEPALSLLGALSTLTMITIAVAICSEFLTGSIEHVSEATHINQGFLGLIVLPIAGNAAEHLTAVFVAIKGKMDLAISVSLGSCIQIAIFVLPLTVVIGWAGGHDFDLDFHPFLILMLLCAVILAYFVSSDGSSNWILGLFLVLDYVLVAYVFLVQKEPKGLSQPLDDLIGSQAK